MMSDNNDPRPRHPLEGNPHPLSEESAVPQRPRITFLVESRLAVVTIGLIIINVALYLLGTTSSTMEQQLFGAGALIRVDIWSDLQLHRLFTAMFLHASLPHLVLNMLALYQIGMRLEQLGGSVRFILVYVLGGLLGSIVSALFGDPLGISVGASGAIFAIWGLDVWILRRHRHLFGDTVRSVLMGEFFFLFGSILLGFLNPRIDNWAHLGGLVGGLILAQVIAPRFVERTAKLPNGQQMAVAVDSHPLNNQRYSLLMGYCVGLIGLLVVGILLFRTQPL